MVLIKNHLAPCIWILGIILNISCRICLHSFYQKSCKNLACMIFGHFLRNFLAFFCISWIISFYEIIKLCNQHFLYIQYLSCKNLARFLSEIMQESFKHLLHNFLDFCMIFCKSLAWFLRLLHDFFCKSLLDFCKISRKNLAWFFWCRILRTSKVSDVSDRLRVYKWMH